MATFPFTAIVGQPDLTRALVLAAIDPSIGGVLAFGERGTGKSTTIRALAALLPEVPNSPLPSIDAEERPTRKATRPAPVVDLPLGATEDRIVGALDIEAALMRGEKRFQPGLLAEAHQGFLYVDEINLLDDHLVDILLDVAASGENIVERDGISLRHPARFVLVGSGNPEEGDLRPQLLDRFGLAVDVRTPRELGERLEIIRRREGFEADPAEFVKRWRRKDLALRRKIEAARAALDDVATPDETMSKAAELCIALGTDGLRGELTITRAARALAAFSGQKETSVYHLREMAVPSLRHRLRKDPLDETDAGERVVRAMSGILDE